jgi:hypothetical protein
MLDKLHTNCFEPVLGDGYGTDDDDDDKDYTEVTNCQRDGGFYHQFNYVCKHNLDRNTFLIDFLFVYTYNRFLPSTSVHTLLLLLSSQPVGAPHSRLLHGTPV